MEFASHQKRKLTNYMEAFGVQAVFIVNGVDGVVGELKGSGLLGGGSEGKGEKEENCRNRGGQLYFSQLIEK